MSHLAVIMDQREPNQRPLGTGAPDSHMSRNSSRLTTVKLKLIISLESFYT